MALRQMTANLISLRTARTHPQVAVPVTVTRAELLTPTMRRLTFHGPDLAAFPALGLDQYVRVLFPRPGQERLALPEGPRWWPALLAMDPAVRPQLRTYTLRHVRPDQAEVDIDFALHEHGGPACQWAAAVEPGASAGLIEQGADFVPDPDADHLLVVADDTGLPAALSILEAVDRPARAVLEVASAADEQPVPLHHDVTWVHRGDEVPGRAALEHVAALPVPPGRGQAWVAGESALATGVRRHLVRCGYAKADVDFTGYFKHGRAQHTD